MVGTLPWLHFNRCDECGTCPPLEAALWTDELVSRALMKSLAAWAEVGLSAMICRISGNECFLLVRGRRPICQKLRHSFDLILEVSQARPGHIIGPLERWHVDRSNYAKENTTVSLKGYNSPSVWRWPRLWRLSTLLCPEARELERALAVEPLILIQPCVYCHFNIPHSALHNYFCGVYLLILCDH